MRISARMTLAWAVCCAVAVPAAGQAGLEFVTQSSAAVINLDDSVPASWLEVSMLWAGSAYSQEGGAVNSIQCLATARNRGELKRGMTLTLEGEVLGLDSEQTLKLLPPKTRPFNPAARFSWDLPDYSASETVLAFGLMGGLGGGQMLDFVKVECRAINRIKCRSDGETLCLVGNNRFKVQLDFGSGQGRVAARTARSGLFTVTNPNRADVVVEMFDRCAMNDHFWVGVGSTTSASFEVVIEDTLSGETRSFANPGSGMAAVDIAAFATCP